MLIEIVKCISRLMNVIFGGTSCLTLSARSHRDELWLEPVIDCFFRLFGEQNHCKNSWIHETKRSKAVLAKDEDRCIESWNRT